jgi:hypothetical protein
MQNRFQTRSSESGDVIDEFNSLEVAQQAVESYEEEDRKEGNYTPNFYEVYDFENKKIVND